MISHLATLHNGVPIDSMIASPKPSTASPDPVTSRYSPDPDHQSPQDQNIARIRLLQKLFGVSITDVAKAGGVSRPYVSRVLKGDLEASPKFYRELEKNLGRLVEERNCHFFWVPVADYSEMELSDLPSPTKPRQ